MILLHTYAQDYVDRLFESGIARRGDGFRLVQNYKTPEERKFNEIAKKDGAFHSFAKENASCIYVDRLQGGTFYSLYSFSKELIDLYNETLERGFLGVQLHELGTTRALDWNRIQRCLISEGLGWTEKNIYEAVRNISTNKEFPHFSQGPAGEYAARQMPRTVTEYVSDLDDVLSARQKATGGNILKCDCGAMHCRTEELFDVRMTMIEVGAQRAHCRVQFALRRGLSRRAGRPWAAYIEPWGGKDCTTYCYNRGGFSDWRRPGDPPNKYPALYKSAGENGGSSISLAGRLMFYSLFAGADYFGEEWGAANTFYDWQTGELTPYGEQKRKMAELSRRLTDVKPWVPVAIILPKNYQLVLTNGAEPRFLNDVTPGKYSDLVQRIIRLFYSGSTLGLEDNLLTNGRYGSIFDIIYEDSYENPSEEYDFLIDFSGRFAGTHPNAADGFREEDMLAKLDRFVAEALPFTLEADRDLDYLLFESGGAQYGCVMNHSGVSKSLEEGECVNPDASVRLCLAMKNLPIAEVLNPCGLRFTQPDARRLQTVLPGGTFVAFRCGE